MEENFVQLGSGLLHGRILGPEELRAECDNLKQRPDLAGYALSGRVTEGEAQLLEDPRTPHGMNFGVLRTKGGALAALVTMQAANLQVRWLVPLLDERSRAWLRWSMANSAFTCLLDIGEGRQVSWCNAPLHSDHRTAIETLLAQSQALDFSVVLAELAVTNAHYAYTEAVPSCIPGIVVEQVRLVAVCDGLFEVIGAHGQQAH